MPTMNDAEQFALQMDTKIRPWVVLPKRQEYAKALLDRADAGLAQWIADERATWLNAGIDVLFGDGEAFAVVGDTEEALRDDLKMTYEDRLEEEEGEESDEPSTLETKMEVTKRWLDIPHFALWCLVQAFEDDLKNRVMDESITWANGKGDGRDLARHSQECWESLVRWYMEQKA